jgi:hypothetical protein
MAWEVIEKTRSPLADAEFAVRISTYNVKKYAKGNTKSLGVYFNPEIVEFFGLTGKQGVVVMLDKESHRIGFVASDNHNARALSNKDKGFPCFKIIVSDGDLKHWVGSGTERIIRSDEIRTEGEVLVIPSGNVPVPSPIVRGLMDSIRDKSIAAKRSVVK